ncbi:30S ribosomal protein S17 [Thalassoglobus polymorphus]|uniref:Small ribosomal subunit protein uS17 n=1 Tax=Thalassoglobus polymorphus TaxID=2527994 RepID=A0A517QI05_9PLAN|nr:30S ribosomal protein S17 [Thalassoglobus polymorphus]
MRTTLIGVVTSDRNSKTRRVDVERLHQHSKYKKIVRGRTVCYVHDENNDSKIGDTIEITECRPRSKSKRWELVRVVKSVSDVASQLKREDQVTDGELNAADIEEQIDSSGADKTPVESSDGEQAATE